MNSVKTPKLHGRNQNVLFNLVEKCLYDFGASIPKYWNRSQWNLCNQLAQSFLEMEDSLSCKIYI